MNFKFSSLAKASMVPSAINELTAGFASNFREGIDINLGVGYVNDKTIPFKAIEQAYNEIVADPVMYRNALNYGGAEGSPNLIKAIKDYYVRYLIGQLDAHDLDNRRILIGANGATSILDAFSDLLQPGYVITADPYYYIYTETLERKGFKILAIPEDNQGLNILLLNQALLQIDPGKISFFYIVTVNNPSTVILSNERRKAIVEVAQELSEKTGTTIPVIFDKAYEDIIHNPAIPNPVSGIKFDHKQQVFEVGTLSKILAPALRIGYIIAPNHSFADVLNQRTSDIGFSASLINEEIAGWLLHHYIDIQKKTVNQGYQNKSSYIKKLIHHYLSDYIENYSGGDAAFYFYLTFKNICTHKDSRFFAYLSRTTCIGEIDGITEKNPRLVYIPGTICSKGEKARFQLRLSYGFEEPEVFERAFKLMAEACRFSLNK